MNEGYMREKEDISLNKTEMNQILNNIEILKIRLDELERKIKKSKPI